MLILSHDNKIQNLSLTSIVPFSGSESGTVPKPQDRLFFCMVKSWSVNCPKPAKSLLHLRGYFSSKKLSVAYYCRLAFFITHYTFLESNGVAEEIVGSQTAGLGDKGNPQVTKELDKCR